MSTKDADEKSRLADINFGGLGALQVAVLGSLDAVSFLVKEVGLDIDSTTGELGTCDIPPSAL